VNVNLEFFFFIADLGWASYYKPSEEEEQRFIGLQFDSKPSSAQDEQLVEVKATADAQETAS